MLECWDAIRPGGLKVRLIASKPQASKLYSFLASKQ